MSIWKIVNTLEMFKILLNRKLNSFLQYQWNKISWFSLLLYPLSLLVHCEAKRRYLFFRKNKNFGFRPSVPVIVIGNIYIGGTGKTPLVISTVSALQERGWKPGILSRGYGIKVGNYPRVGIGDLSSTFFGDESAMISRCTDAPVSIHPKRELAAKALLTQFPETNVIISDDGLQYFALSRDLEIVVQDDRGIGNGFLLPAGPLRETTARLKEAYAIVTNKDKLDKECSNRVRGIKNIHLDMSLEITYAKHVEKKKKNLPIWNFSLTTQFSKVVAAAGIGNPERFFKSLKKSGIKLSNTLVLPDHYSFSISPFENISADAILITSKDSIKCSHLKDERLWEVPVNPRFSNPYFFDQLSRSLITLKSKI